MRIHTDVLNENDLWATLPGGCHLEVSRHGSRKRDHAFEVGMSAVHGTDAHGIKRCYARNTGNYGGAGEYDRAATWIEWGDWMVALFKRDPNALIGPYEGAESFVRETQWFAPHRPDRENAEAHADRWSTELFFTRNNPVAERLEYLRGELRAERISYGELHELQSLSDHIENGDVELLEAAGVSKDEARAQGRL